MNFKVGDRVSHKRFGPDLPGTIIFFDEGGSAPVLIEFDECIKDLLGFGHDGGGIGKDGHCWWSTEFSLCKVPEKNKSAALRLKKKEYGTFSSISSDRVQESCTEWV